MMIYWFRQQFQLHSYLIMIISYNFVSKTKLLFWFYVSILESFNWHLQIKLLYIKISILPNYVLGWCQLFLRLFVFPNCCKRAFFCLFLFQWLVQFSGQETSNFPIPPIPNYTQHLHRLPSCIHQFVTIMSLVLQSP